MATQEERTISLTQEYMGAIRFGQGSPFETVGISNGERGLQLVLVTGRPRAEDGRFYPWIGQVRDEYDFWFPGFGMLASSRWPKQTKRLIVRQRNVGIIGAFYIYQATYSSMAWRFASGQFKYRPGVQAA